MEKIQKNNVHGNPDGDIVELVYMRSYNGPEITPTLLLLGLGAVMLRRNY